MDEINRRSLRMRSKRFLPQFSSMADSMQRRSFVLHALGDDLASVDPAVAAAEDYKTLLQEKHQAEYGDPPRYEVVNTAGPPHRRSFCVEVHWHGGSVRGEGHTIKAAEAVAARNALEQMQLPRANN